MKEEEELKKDFIKKNFDTGWTLQ